MGYSYVPCIAGALHNSGTGSLLKRANKKQREGHILWTTEEEWNNTYRTGVKEKRREDFRKGNIFQGNEFQRQNVLG